MCIRDRVVLTCVMCSIFLLTFLPTKVKVRGASSSVIVPILDEGAMYPHPDLAANMWCHAGASVQGAQTDGDGNGYEGDLHGYNFVTESGDITLSLIHI